MIMRTSATAISLALSFLCVAPVNLLADDRQGEVAFPEHLRQLPNGLPFPNPTGFASTFSTTGSVDLANEFFQDLGANGRRCVSCHLPSAGWTIVPSQVQAIFERTLGGVIDDALGLGAIFRTNDGSNSPAADVSSLAARRSAYSMVLTKGLIRVGIGVPDTADFELVAVDDPYHFASGAELSLFRRPLPTTNLQFLSTVMWDGRETFGGTDHCNIAAEGGKCFASIHFDLADQSNGATQGHAQAPNPISSAQREAIVAFETALATAQVWDENAERLQASDAKGDRKSTRLNSSHSQISYAVFCLKKKKKTQPADPKRRRANASHRDPAEPHHSSRNKRRIRQRARTSVLLLGHEMRT